MNPSRVPVTPSTLWVLRILSLDNGWPVKHGWGRNSRNLGTGWGHRLALAGRQREKEKTEQYKRHKWTFRRHPQGGPGKRQSQFISLLLHLVQRDFPKDTAQWRQLFSHHTGDASLVLTFLLHLFSTCYAQLLFESTLHWLHSVQVEPALQSPLQVVALVTLGNYLLAGEHISSLNRVYAKMIQNGLQEQVWKLWFHTWHCIRECMWFSKSLL